MLKYLINHKRWGAGAGGRGPLGPPLNPPREHHVVCIEKKHIQAKRSVSVNLDK